MTNRLKSVQIIIIVIYVHHETSRGMIKIMFNCDLWLLFSDTLLPLRLCAQHTCIVISWAKWLPSCGRHSERNRIHMHAFRDAIEWISNGRRMHTAWLGMNLHPKCDDLMVVNAFTKWAALFGFVIWKGEFIILLVFWKFSDSWQASGYAEIFLHHDCYQTERRCQQRSAQLFAPFNYKS